MNEVLILKEVKAMLADFNSYFSYLHGKSQAVELMMPDAAVSVWARIYQELTPDERMKAKEAVYERHSFHPTPEQFRQLVRGSDEGEALQEWINILDALRMSQDDAIAKVKLLSPYARQALRVIGGLSGLGMCPEAALHKSVKEDFCRAWRLIRANGSPHPLEKVSETPQSVTDIDITEATAKLSASYAMPPYKSTENYDNEDYHG